MLDRNERPFRVGHMTFDSGYYLESRNGIGLYARK